MSLQSRAGLAHERDRLGEHPRHHRADLLGLRVGVALEVDAFDRRDGHVNCELDRVVGPRESLLPLHLFGELGETTLELLRVAEDVA